MVAKSGAAGLVSYIPLQVGGGDTVNFQIDAGALQFPRISSEANKEINYHGSNNSIGISYAGKSGDVIRHTNSVITSPSPYYWEVNTGATSSCTWDFSGLVVVGSNVTLRNVTTFDSMSFSSCLSLNFSNCNVTNSSISNVPTTGNTLTTNSATTIDSCTINTTAILTGSSWCHTSDPSIFSYCTFNSSISSGHAIRITSIGTFNLEGIVFNNFGSASTTSAAIYNDSGGLVTLNITNGGSTPTIRNGVGASTTVNSNVQITLTDLVNPSEVRVYLAGTQTAVDGQENVTSGTFVFSVGTSVTVDISIISLSYQILRIKNYSSAADTSLPIQQIVDRQYQNS